MMAIVGTDAELELYQTALAKASGMPRRGTVVGGPDYLPRSYYPGAPGWTDRIADVIDTANGKRALEVPQQLHGRMGERIRVGLKDVQLPPKSALVDVDKKPEQPSVER